MDAIQFDITPQLNKFNKLADSMDFIISKSINDLSFEQGRKDLSNELKDKTQTRNKTFNNERAIRIKRSNKKNLSVELFHFKEELGLQQFGGIETPQGKKLAIPIRRNMAKYANVPNNKNIPKSLKIDTILEKAPTMKDKTKIYRTKGVKPFIGNRGVYIRVDEGLRLLYVFRDKAEHKKQLINFQIAIERTFNTNLENYINREYLKLLRG